MKSLSNISVKDFRAALTLLGLSPIRTKGGHEAWMKKGMLRPVIFQSHINPIPEFIIRNNLSNIGISKVDFISILNKV